MSGFSTAWLALREPADMRARSRDVADAVNARFLTRERISVVDLGCGTGANLRGTAPLLPLQQSWTLVDHDAGLLTAARAELAQWADEGIDRDGVLHLQKGRQTIDVTFKRADLSGDLDEALGEPSDLVTAAAFFDLVSPEFIRDCARAVAARKAAFLTVLTYNGLTQWTPRHPLDREILAAFHRHQTGDKGFGAAAGPTAPAHLADHFRLNGFAVIEGNSPWRLTAGDADLIADLKAGHVSAARETKRVTEADLASWGGLKKTGVEIGHTDTFAVLNP